MLTAIIVDDERLARVNLKKLLEPFKNIIVVDEADSCAAAIQSTQHHAPDLLFLDIQLLGESGFDIIEKINPKIKIIFVTAYDQYAIRAFKVNALDYLLKPVDPDRLKIAIDRIRNQDDQPSNTISKFQYDDLIYVKLNKSKSKFIKIKNIRYISSLGNYTKLTLTEHGNPIILKTMKLWQKELPIDKFVRIHHSTIVNIEHIEKIEKTGVKNHQLRISGISQPLDISRRYMTNLRSHFKT